MRLAGDGDAEPAVSFEKRSQDVWPPCKNSKLQCAIFGKPYFGAIVAREFVTWLYLDRQDSSRVCFKCIFGGFFLMLKRNVNVSAVIIRSIGRQERKSLIRRSKTLVNPAVLQSVKILKIRVKRSWFIYLK